MQELHRIPSDGNKINPLRELIYSDALDSTMDGIIFSDKNLNIVYANQSARTFLGCSQGLTEFAEWNEMLELFHSDGTTKLSVKELPAYKVLQGEKVSDYRFFIKSATHPEGIHVSCNGTAVTINDELRGAILTLRDITESFKTQQRLSEQRAFFKTILDVIPASIYLFNHNGSIEFTNKHFDEGLRGFINSLEMHEGTQEIHHALRTKHGQERHFRTIKFTFHDEHGETGHGGISFDETEQVKSIRNIESDRIKAISASKMASIGNLAGEIGHEINNPLSIIKSITFLLKDMLKDGEVGRMFILDRLETIDQTVDRMTSIVQSLKNISHKGQKNTKTTCFLKDVLDDVILMSDMKFKKLGIKLTSDFDERLLKTPLNCYRVQLSEVILNLLSNAADAVEGQNQPWVHVKLKDKGDLICIEVSDSGAGVPLEIRNEIFEPYFTTKEIGKGSGLGLSISRSIMKEHGGRLVLRPEISPSCFALEIPKNRVD